MLKQKPLALAAVDGIDGRWPPCPRWRRRTRPQNDVPVPLQTVEVTGIRASMAKSLNVKKNSAPTSK
jgi:hypothetical protein